MECVRTLEGRRRRISGLVEPNDPENKTEHGGKRNFGQNADGELQITETPVFALAIPTRFAMHRVSKSSALAGIALRLPHSLPQCLIVDDFRTGSSVQPIA